jgi:hypothetical protein
MAISCFMRADEVIVLLVYFLVQFDMTRSTSSAGMQARKILPEAVAFNGRRRPTSAKASGAPE